MTIFGSLFDISLILKILLYLRVSLMEVFLSSPNKKNAPYNARIILGCLPASKIRSTPILLLVIENFTAHFV